MKHHANKTMMLKNIRTYVLCILSMKYFLRENSSCCLLIRILHILASLRVTCPPLVTRDTCDAICPHAGKSVTAAKNVTNMEPAACSRRCPCPLSPMSRGLLSANISARYVRSFIPIQVLPIIIIMLLVFGPGHNFEVST